VDKMQTNFDAYNLNRYLRTKRRCGTVQQVLLLIYRKTLFFLQIKFYAFRGLYVLELLNVSFIGFSLK